MLTLEAQVLNVYETPRGTNRETGEEYGGKARVQLLAANVLRNGENRQELIDLTVDDPAPFRELIGKPAKVPVGAFVAGNTVRYFHAKRTAQQHG